MSTKGIISSYFMNTATDNRTQIQQNLIPIISANFGQKIPILSQAVSIKAFWLN